MFPKMSFSQTALQWFEVLPGMSLVLPGFTPALLGAPRHVFGTPRWSQTHHHHSHGTPIPDISNSSYSKGRLECPPMVWHSPEIDASKFTLLILWDTPGGSQGLNYILLIEGSKLAQRHSSNLLNLRFVVPAWKLLLDVLKSDRLEEQDERLERCFQYSKGLM